MNFIHIADIHLGAVPDRGCSWSAQRGQEIWDSFRRVIEIVKEEKTELLLIAGDLFHRQPLLRELKEVNYLFSTIPDTKIVLIAGNHDYLKRDSYYWTFSWADNVTCLWNEKPSVVHFRELDTYVYGLSYHSQEIKEAVYDEIRPRTEKGGIHILLAHGGDASHAPMNKQMLQAAGYDYIALGHIHKPEILCENKMAYAGALEPIDRTETGMHGYIQGEYSNGKMSIRFVPHAVRSYKKIEVSVEAHMGQYELEELVKDLIRMQGDENLFQLVLTGHRDPHWYPDETRLLTLGNVTEVEDLSQADYCLEDIYREYKGSLLGEYAAYFMDRERTEIEEKAVQYGLSALLAARE